MADIKSNDLQSGDTHSPLQTDPAAQASAEYGDGARSVDAARQAGGDGAAARYPGQNALQSAGAVGGGAVGVTHNVLRQAIGATEDVGSGLVGGVTHLAQDIVHGVHDVAVDATAVVQDGATGLIGAVGEVGSRTVHALTDLVVDLVGGVREIAGAAMGHGAPVAQSGSRADLAAGGGDIGGPGVGATTGETLDDTVHAGVSQQRQRQSRASSGGEFSPGL
jgi:hypothetical protein